MGKSMLTLNCVAGYMTERNVWRLLEFLSSENLDCDIACLSAGDIAIKESGFELLKKDRLKPNEISAFLPPERNNGDNGVSSKQSGVWTLGALAFYALLGVGVFEGKGGVDQDEKTTIPRVHSSHASYTLSNLIFKCLNYIPSNRPTLDEIHRMAKEELEKEIIPPRRLMATSSKIYTNSIVSFWPEEMVLMLLFLFLLLHPMQAKAQPKQNIPDEMSILVNRCVKLRDKNKMDEVQREMGRDNSWTIMDELKIDRNGECTIKDEVEQFRLNDLAYKLLKRRGGITNANGRLRDGRDPNYNYSFIEITVKKNHEVSYKIEGREGRQLFAVIPYYKQSDYQVNISHKETKKGDLSIIDGVTFIALNQKLTKADELVLTINNNSDRNHAFVIINYNSRDIQ